jgi:hypothetical protein
MTVSLSFFQVAAAGVSPIISRVRLPASLFPVTEGQRRLADAEIRLL